MARRAKFRSASISRRATLALRSVVAIRTVGMNGETTATGTGFAVNRETIATDYHVIKNAHRILISRVTDSTEYLASVSLVDNVNDLALLKVSKAPEWKPLPVTRTGIQTGDVIYAVSNPRGLEGTFSAGNVSALRRLRDGRELVQITAPVSPGSSGGPVLNQRGEVVGVVVSGLMNAQNINFAVPASYLRKLILAQIREATAQLMPRTAGVGIEEDHELASLRGLPGLHVVVERIEPEFQSLGFDESSMEIDAERDLSAAGVKISHSVGAPWLYINLTLLLLEGRYSYSLYVELNQLVITPRTKAELYAATWHRSMVGSCTPDRLQGIKEQIAEKINQFVADYKLANKKQ